MWWAWDGFSSNAQSHVIIPVCPSRERGQTFSGLEQHLRWILGLKSGGVLSLDSSGNETAQLESICTCSCSYVLCALVIGNILLLQLREIPRVWLPCSNCWQVISKSQVPFLKWLAISMTKYFYLYIQEKHWVKTPLCDCKQTASWDCLLNVQAKVPCNLYHPVVLWREVRYAALPTQDKTISLTVLRAVHPKILRLTHRTFSLDQSHILPRCIRSAVSRNSTM